MKAAYEKPVMLRLETGYLNKFGSSPMYSRRVRKAIDGVSNILKWAVQEKEARETRHQRKRSAQRGHLNVSWTQMFGGRKTVSLR